LASRELRITKSHPFLGKRETRDYGLEYSKSARCSQVLN